MAKLYIEIDTESKIDMALFTEGRKGVATLEMAQDAIDALVGQPHGLMICRADNDPVVVQEFEVMPLEEAVRVSHARVYSSLAAYTNEPLIISAQHVDENEKGN